MNKNNQDEKKANNSGLYKEIKEPKVVENTNTMYTRLVKIKVNTKIEVISKSQIRYCGILLNNLNELVLENVNSFGTENRNCIHFVPPGKNIYNRINLKFSNILAFKNDGSWFVLNENQNDFCIEHKGFFVDTGDKKNQTKDFDTSWKTKNKISSNNKNENNLSVRNENELTLCNRHEPRTSCKNKLENCSVPGVNNEINVSIENENNLDTQSEINSNAKNENNSSTVIEKYLSTKNEKDADIENENNQCIENKKYSDAKNLIIPSSKNENTSITETEMDSSTKNENNFNNNNQNNLSIKNKTDSYNKNKFKDYNGLKNKTDSYNENKYITYSGKTEISSPFKPRNFSYTSSENGDQSNFDDSNSDFMNRSFYYQKNNKKNFINPSEKTLITNNYNFNNQYRKNDDENSEGFQNNFNRGYNGNYYGKKDSYFFGYRKKQTKKYFGYYGNGNTQNSLHKPFGFKNNDFMNTVINNAEKRVDVYENTLQENKSDKELEIEPKNETLDEQIIGPNTLRDIKRFNTFYNQDNNALVVPEKDFDLSTSGEKEKQDPDTLAEQSKTYYDPDRDFYDNLK